MTSTTRCSARASPCASHHDATRLSNGRARLLLAIAAASLLTGRPAAAQLPDSAAGRRAAEAAQARFETIRRAHLPITRTAAGSRCEERIGRLCYWYDPGAPTDPGPESARITEAREALLAQLAAAAARHPADGWVTGQRVRYLVETGDTTAARAIAAACAGTEWWCAALTGFVAHAAGAAAAADTAFARALVAAPDGIRCEWTELALILPDDARAGYGALPCGPARDSANAVIWWLGRPLHGRPGNELRAEHYARLTMVELLRDARTPYGMRWGADMREMVVRYGWSRWWSRDFPRPMEAQPAITGHERAPSFHFLPASRALADPLSADPDDWALDVPRARHRFAPRWARRVVPLPAQLGVFRRGDSALVVAAWDASADSALGGHTTVRWASLALGPQPGAPSTRDSLAHAPTVGRLTLTVPLRPALASLELVALDSAAGAARYRTGLAMPDGDGHTLGVSAPLLVHVVEADPAVSTLQAVLPRMLHREEVVAPGRVALYWEAYGLPADATPVRVRLSLRGGERGWLRRLGDRLQRREVAPPPTIAWDDVLHSPSRDSLPSADDRPMAGAGSGRLITVDLPALAAGAYALTVRIETADGASAEATRHLHVRRR